MHTLAFPAPLLFFYDSRRVLGYDGTTDEDRATRRRVALRALPGRLRLCLLLYVHVYAGVVGGAAITYDSVRTVAHTNHLKIM